jgi:hypothetical protein
MAGASPPAGPGSIDVSSMSPQERAGACSTGSCACPRRQQTASPCFPRWRFRSTNR